MIESIQHLLRRGIRSRGALTAILLLFCLSAMAFGSGLVSYSLCDIRVLYLFDDVKSVDWPTLYYLNDNFGCRVDLLMVRPSEVFRQNTREATDREIYLNEYYLPDSNQIWIDSLMAEVFQKRRPDIVLLDGFSHSKLLSAVAKYILALTPTDDHLFNILRIYERTVVSEDTSGTSGRVVLNGKELLTRYRERIEYEIPMLFPSMKPQNLTARNLTAYKLVKTNLEQDSPAPDFIYGISQMRLTRAFEEHIGEGPKKEVLLTHAKQFISAFNDSQLATGKARVDLIISGYRQLRYLAEFTDFGEKLDSLVDFRPYLDDLIAKAEKTALDAVGVAWQGKIFLRDSPHGPKLKFRVSLSVNGPKEIELSAVRFHPYWDTAAVILDSVPKTILPHQSYVREYFIDMDRTLLEAQQAESLLFTTQITYGKVPLVFSSSLPIWESPDLQVRFEPNYYFIQPFDKLDVDRVVSSTTLRVVISKPQAYSGTSHLNLETPRGLFAGAYRQEIQLNKGSTHVTLLIPFTISNLFELGIQPIFLTLTVNGKVVSADTALVRIAACHISNTLKVGFLPDSTGALEDVLRMTDAGFQPLTDHALMTANLDAYNVIVVGSGSFRHYPSFRFAKGRFEDYLRHGGSIVVMGQSDDWLEGTLPVSLVPSIELVDRSEITNRIPEARVLSRPYSISESNLLSSFGQKRNVASAVISPAEKVYVTSSGRSLLSVSRLGEGQIIYCGFPLLEMISKLEIDAIHLFANILNY